MSWCCLLPDLSTGLVFGAVLALAWWWRTSRPRNLPPGPSGHFLFGNLKEFGLRPEINFMKFAKQYGPVFKLYFANRLMVVLNGYDVIKATLVGQADAFADRPSLYINNTVTGVNGLSQLPYGGRRLKEQRKFAFSCLREIGRVGKIELEEKIVQEMEVLYESPESTKRATNLMQQISEDLNLGSEGMISMHRQCIESAESRVALQIISTILGNYCTQHTSTQRRKRNKVFQIK